MELMLSCIVFCGAVALVSSVIEWFDWEQSYWRAGEEDREYQRNTKSTPPYKADYRE